jgi:hypothetical protein
MIPCNADTRESYIQRTKDGLLHLAQVHHKIGNTRSTWLTLLYYAMAEDLYGEHYDDLKRREK